MTSSQTVRDPLEDDLLTPRNAALLIVDFQPVQVSSIASMDRRMLVANIVAVARTGFPRADVNALIDNLAMLDDVLRPKAVGKAVAAAAPAQAAGDATKSAAAG